MRGEYLTLPYPQQAGHLFSPHSHSGTLTPQGGDTMCCSFSPVDGKVAGVLTEDNLFAKLFGFGYMDAALI